MDVLLTGDAEQAAALESALSDRGLEIHLHASEGPLAKTLVDLEELIEAGRPRLALGVGRGDAALALAITAPKLGVPFCARLDDESDERQDERRILETLSAADLPDLGGDDAATADRIVAWLAEVPPVRNIRSNA